MHGTPGGAEEWSSETAGAASQTPEGVSAPNPDGAPAEGGRASELEQLKTELDAAKDRSLRALADLENFKKRAAREKADALRFGNEGLLRDLLPVIDNLQRAIEHGRASREIEPIIAGVELVLRSFGEVLARHGVTAVEARGQQFDPSRHEAIGHVASAEPSNTVVSEHQRGYLLHDRLLRPALVTVGKGPGERAERGNGAAAEAPDVENGEDDG